MSPPARPEAAAVVLAAGGSRRLGSPKPLLAWNGRPLVRRAVDSVRAAGCHPVYVVVGSRAEQVAGALAGDDAAIVENAHWMRGLGSSIAAGVRAATAEVSPTALLLTLVDQPHVSAPVLARLLAAFDGDAVASRYAGVPGPPAVFGPAHFPALGDLEGDRGAYAILRGLGARLRTVDFEAGAVDIDTPEDWEAFLSDPPDASYWK